MLRGLFAASIMVYHSLLWTFPAWFEQPAGIVRLIDWLGIYGVEGFFVISAFSLYHVYRERPLGTKAGLRDFFWKRVVRLWPLYMAAVGVAVLARLVLEHKTVAPSDLLLNTTMLFGFVNPARSLIIGGWSIGVEIVLYCLFVPLVVLGQRSQTGLLLACAGLIATTLAYPYLFLSQTTLSEQWSLYVNVFNHVGFFAMGVGLYMGWQKRQEIGILMPLMGAIGVLKEATTYQDQSSIVLGQQRFWSFIVTGSLCFVMCRVQRLPHVLSAPLAALGAISYSVYLLHPFAYKLFEKVSLSGPTLVGLTWASTLAVAALSYRFLEKPLVAWGKKVAKGWAA